MKHTFIFIADEDVTEDDLYRLAQVADIFPVSYKTAREERYYTQVQFFTDDHTMHQIAHRAGFSGEQLRQDIPAARRRGDSATRDASKRLDDLRRKAADKQALHSIRYSTTLQMPGGTRRSKRSA